MRVWLAVLPLFLFVSCVSLDAFNKVYEGMPMAEVRQTLGEPASRTFVHKRTEWHYTNYNGPDKIVVFEKGKVVAMVDDEVAERRRHELAVAQAGATHINIGGNGSGGFRCAHWNAFGHYADGGGCNVHGCWPPGGECTVFGCSSAGSCGAVTCVGKTTTYTCIE